MCTLRSRPVARQSAGQHRPPCPGSPFSLRATDTVIEGTHLARNDRGETPLCLDGQKRPSPLSGPASRSGLRSRRPGPPVAVPVQRAHDAVGKRLGNAVDRGGDAGTLRRPWPPDQHSGRPSKCVHRTHRSAASISRATSVPKAQDKIDPARRYVGRSCISAKMLPVELDPRIVADDEKAERRMRLAQQGRRPDQGRVVLLRVHAGEHRSDDRILGQTEFRTYAWAADQPVPPERPEAECRSRRKGPWSGRAAASSGSGRAYRVRRRRSGSQRDRRLPPVICSARLRMWHSTGFAARRPATPT